MSESERSFFRVHGLAGLRVERLDDRRWEEEEHAIRSDWTEAREAPDSEIARWLDRVEQKLDLLLDRLEVDNPQKALRFHAQGVVISGGGISFDSEQRFGEGDRLLVELELGVPPVFIRCLGSVVRCEKRDSDYRMMIRFEVIREVDRDRIIEYALETERRSIQSGGGSAAA